MLDDIKKTLWATADKLRANMDAAEYKHLVLGLIFVKYISDTFAARRAELTTRLTNPADDYYFPDGITAKMAGLTDSHRQDLMTLPTSKMAVTRREIHQDKFDDLKDCLLSVSKR